MIIDSDAHVVETEHTWDYLDASEKKFRPQLFQSADNLNSQYWFLDGKAIGFRAPTLTEQELVTLSKQTGRDLKTAPEARELRDVALRLRHMDKLGIDVQVLFNTMWIARVADKAEAEIALCASWNRWMADVWKQGKNRLRWSCVVPAMTLSEALQQMRFAKGNGLASEMADVTASRGAPGRKRRRPRRSLGGGASPGSNRLRLRRCNTSGTRSGAACARGRRSLPT